MTRKRTLSQNERATEAYAPELSDRIRAIPARTIEEDDFTMAARQSAKSKAAERAARLNAPSAAEFDNFLDRLHEINDRMDEDNGTHKADMKSVYDEAAKALDMPVEVVSALFKSDRRERKAQKKMSKADQRVRDSFMKASQAYGDDSPLGQYAKRMADAAGKGIAETRKGDTEEGEAAAAAKAEGEE